MRSKSLPTLKEVKKHYNINFNEYAIAVLHSVTTDILNFKNYTQIFVKSLLNSNKNFVVIYPNNDYGSNIIFREYQNLKKK